MLAVEMITRETWRARRYREADKEGVLRLSRSHYREKEQAQESYFDWLYNGAHAGRALVTVAENPRTGDIIGFLWHVPFHVTVQGRPALCYLGCNGLVHPDYRRQGIYVALYNRVFDSSDTHAFLYGFAKPVAVHPLQKVGVFEAGHIPLLIKPLDMATLARTRLTNPLLRALVTLGWRGATATLRRPRRTSHTGSALRVRAERGFDESFDAFWANVSAKYAILINRDRAFLTWRFCTDPQFRTYDLLSARAGEELVGYLVARVVEVEGVRSGLVMDLLVEPGARGDAAGGMLIDEATRRFAAAGASLAGCLMLGHTQEHRLLRRAGYLVCPERLAPQPFRLVTRTLSPVVSNGLLARMENWFLTMANHDAV